MRKRSVRILDSFGYAIRGLYYAFRSQRHMKVHVTVATAIVFAGFNCEITKIEWLLLVLAISGVMVTELINTSIELSIDLVTKKLRPRAMLAKDVAAGAVFLSAIAAVIIGIIIFGDKFLEMIATLI
ncbi:MAG TPA: diacylglycerol kinase [Candidatus Margulisbacteria bacterium]|nr:MAG: hypothetical protein A2X42_07680 [Candidatus Margulisbacteria bacterium GWF2_38_17]OGI11894.1 MAG: hypothetical protein A2X41_11590 [Candidatus Margulisbacteria bacterium GWE2_39_32]HCT84030.1 diacylglycerol kinase [Candidatus Margulisiibacteriota bacterium]